MQNSIVFFLYLMYNYFKEIVLVITTNKEVEKVDKLQLKDFLGYKFLSNLEMSSDSQSAAFVVSVPDLANNKYNSNIWILNKEAKRYSKLTSLNNEKNFTWLDSETILFSSMRNTALKNRIYEGEEWTLYYYININGGEAEEFMKIPLNVNQIQSIDGDNFVVLANYDKNKVVLNGLKGKKRCKAKAKLADSKSYVIVDEIPFWSNGAGYTNKKRNRLYLFNNSNNELTPLTDEYTDVESFNVKDGKVLYVANRYKEKYELYDSLNLYDIETRTNKVLIPQSKYSIGYTNFIQDKIIVMLSDMKDLGMNENKNFYVYDDDKLEFLAKFDTGFGSSVSSDCRYGGGRTTRVIDDTLFFVSTIGKSSFLSKLTLDGKISLLSEDLGSVDSFDTDGKDLLFIGLRGMKLNEIYSIRNNVEVQLTAFNENIPHTKVLSEPIYIPFTNSDGVEIDGFVIKPVDYDETKSYPAILDIHGGPKTVFGKVFFHEMQVWANMGYFVFFCNPRGSDGKGDKFSDIRGKYGTIDYNDIMEFTDHILENYEQIDAKRVGVTGGSYGGFMTNWIIGHTDKFRCAVSQRSISNWISKFGTTDIGYFFNEDQINATPWIDQEKLWWHSPLKYADKVSTPTLFIHSEEDYRCWTPESIQMFTALKYHKIEARLCIFKGDNHELSRSGSPKNRVKRLEEITNWFEKHLK